MRTQRFLRTVQYVDGNISELSCCRCREVKPVGSFPRWKGHPTGHALLCRECSKQDRERFKERNTKHHQEYYQKNRKELLARMSAYQRANPEFKKRRQRAYQERHRERLMLEAREDAKRAYRRCPEKFKARARASRAWRRHGIAVRDLTASQWRDILTQFSNRCVYCTKYLDSPTQDHLLPLSRGGEHTAANVAPACVNCNSRKRTKTYEEYVGRPFDASSLAAWCRSCDGALVNTSTKAV